MDLLASYGSSDSDPDSSRSDNDDNEKKRSASNQEATATNGKRLKLEEQPQRPAADNGTAAASTAKRPGADAAADRNGDGGGQRPSLFSSMLPRPPLLVDAGNDGDDGDAMIYWSKDYLTQRHEEVQAAEVEARRRGAIASKAQDAEAETKDPVKAKGPSAETAAPSLPYANDKSERAVGGWCCYGHELLEREQHNFTNPHQFGSVAERLNVRNAMGSTLPPPPGLDVRFEDWERYDLERLELEAQRRRQREYQQQQPPSRYAQEQFERAFQQRDQHQHR